jgi:hypothetical protein
LNPALYNASPAKLLALLLALLPLADASYGPSGAWCWVRPERVAWVFAQFYAPMWIAVAFNAAVYVGTRRLLLKTPSLLTTMKDELTLGMCLGKRVSADG